MHLIHGWKFCWIDFSQGRMTMIFVECDAFMWCFYAKSMLLIWIGQIFLTDGRICG